MKFMKKSISFLVASSILVTSLAGCKGNILGDKKINKDPITLTMFVSDLKQPLGFDDDVAKKITELTGVTLKFTYAENGFKKPIDLMIAKEDYPDLIYAKGDTNKLIDAKAIIKLDDYIETKGDNIKKLYGDQINRLKNSLEDPSIYTVGTYGVSSAVWDPSGTMQIQNKVLKELGYPKIKTMHDYEQAVKEYIKKYPTINGQKTYALTLMASDWRWLITCGNIAAAAAGIPDDGQFKVDEETQKATYKFELPEVKEYFKWLNHMNAEGLLDPTSFTQSEKEYKDKLLSGSILGISDAKWDYNDVTKTLVSQGKEDQTFAPLPVTISEKYKDQSLKDYGFGGAPGIAISKSSPNKERAFEFLDWMASDEAQVLVNWGIEGKHYKVENGKRVFLPEIQEQKNTDKEFLNKTGIEKYVYPFPQKGDGAVDSTGNTYTTNTVEKYIENYNSAEKETLKAYGVKSWDQMFPKADELGVSKHGQIWKYTIPSDSDITLIQNNIDSYTQKAITKAIVGSESDFDAAWEKIQKDMKEMRVSELDEGMSALTSEKMKLWNN